MSRRKKIIIALSLLFAFGIFMFGETLDPNITQTFSNFKETTSTDTFKMIKFSTEDYPTIKAYFYLAIDENQPNIKLSDGIFDPSNAVRIGNVDEKGITIREIDSDTKGKELDFYYICIEYTVSDLSNKNRNAEFYIVNSKNLTTKINNYSVGEIEALFTNPDRDKRILTRQDNKIILSGKAYSKPKRGTYYADPNGDTGTTISSNITKTKFISKAESESYEVIDSGKFKIDGYDDVPGVVGLPYAEDNKTYYPVTLEINSTSNADIYNSLILNPNGRTLTFTAKSESELEASDILDGVNVVEKDPPIITNITTINKTLKAFMDTILPNNSSLYTQTISSPTGITSLSNNLLNVKEGDEIEVEFTVDDENITDSKGELRVFYNGVEYNYINGEGGANPIIYKGINGTKTTWKMTIPNYYINSNDISFRIEYASLDRNKLPEMRLPAFTNPAELNNTKINVNTNPAGTTIYPNYYKNTSININTSELSDAIAYMVVYDLDKSKSDLGPTETLSNKWKAVLKTTPTFNFGDGDGEYKYAEVYTINKAGAIKGITSPSVNDFDSIQSAINLKDKNSKFYIDTVAPRVISYEFWKYSNGNSSEIDDNNNLVKNLLLGQNKPYKSNDVVGFKAVIKEYNMDATTDTSGIITWGGNSTVGTYDITNGAIYEKKGTALDLTSSVGRVDKIISSTFYDKAGNSTLSSNTNIIYDDREPKVVETKDDIVGIVDKDKASPYSMKFTKNTNLPLIVVEDISFAPVSLAILGLNSSSEKYIGAINNVGDTNLISFAKTNDPTNKFKPIKNGENNLEMDVYSHSGVKKPMPDKIVLDTEINYLNSNINDNSYTKDTNYNIVSLNNLLDVVRELVGLKSFTVTKTGLGDKSLISDNGADKPLGTSISLNDYSNYNTSWLPTSYSNLSPSRKYELKIPKGVKGKLVYKIELEDRLGHKKIVNYTTIVSEETKIIGKTNGSSKEIVTKIKTGNNVKIDSRTEGK